MEEQIRPRSRWLPVYASVWWATLPMLGLLVWRVAQRPDVAFELVVRGLLLMGLALLIVPQVVYFLSGRSLHASSTAFFVVCMLLVLVQLPIFKRPEPTSDWHTLSQEMNKAVQGVADRLEGELDGTSAGPVSVGAYYLEVSDTFEALGERLGGDSGQAASALASVTRDFVVFGSAYDHAVELLTKHDSFDFGSLQSTADVRERIRIVDIGLSTCRAFNRAVTEFPARMREALGAAGMPDRERNRLAGEFAESMDLRQPLIPVQFDLKVLSATRRMLVALRDHWGQWTWNPETEELETHSDELIEKFGSALEEAQAAIEEHETAQRRNLTRLHEYIEEGKR